MNGKKIVVGVTGGIAAYKTAMLVSQLVQKGASVAVVMTEAAERFIGEATFAALTGKPVAKSLFGDPQYPLGAHIGLAQNQDLLIIAPATANFLSMTAAGAAPDLLSTLYLAFDGPVLVAPAMNSQMWEHPAVKRNVDQLRADGIHFVDPASGWLSCRQVGAGRMAEPAEILAAVEQLLR